MKQEQLSKEEITQILEFVKSKYVRYKDVQFELVDHLATNIEEQMVKDSTINFNKALEVAYSEFPITGFSKFVQSKTSALQKYWKARFFSFFKSYFKLPKVFLIIAMSIACYLMILYVPFSLKTFGYIYLGTIYLAMFASMRSYRKKAKLRKLLLVEESYYGMVHWFAMAPVLIMPYLPTVGIDSQITLVIFSMLCAFILIFFYGLFKAFPEQLKNEMEQKYSYLA